MFLGYHLLSTEVAHPDDPTTGQRRENSNSSCESCPEKDNTEGANFTYKQQSSPSALLVSNSKPHTTLFSRMILGVIPKGRSSLVILITRLSATCHLKDKISDHHRDDNEGMLLVTIRCYDDTKRSSTPCDFFFFA
jgi:hypothetical protein